MGETAMHRPYIRSEVRAEVENRAQRDEQGRFLDANTGKPIEGRYDLGHKAGHEHWRESERAEREGLTQEEFNNRMNNPDYYQIEDPHSNRSHEYEDKTPEELECWHRMVAAYLKEKNMASAPDCSYAHFVRQKLPRAWEIYTESGE